MRRVRLRWRTAQTNDAGSCPGRQLFGNGLPALLRDDSRALAVAFDVDALSRLQPRVDGLRRGDEHAAPDTHDDLLPGHRLVVLFVDLV